MPETSDDRPARGPEAGSAEELLLHCFEHPESEWDRLLAELCAEHPAQAAELRRRCEALRGIGFLGAPAGERELEPVRFGEFRLLRKIGRGGMGIVYLARQESLGRDVALKILHAGPGSDPQARERFKREIELTSKLELPGICSVHEAGETDGTPWVAMRFVDGETLAARIARERARAVLPGAGAVLAGVAMLEQVARTLHEAHRRGLVHRDVKPGNVMVTRDGAPVLLDFGLARGAESGWTVHGAMVGTPAYMAPEQVDPRGRTVDARVDVYGLGATLFECVTLRLPFPATGREELFHSILHARIPDARSLNPAVPRELAVILAKALARDPADRYANALDLAEDLRRMRVHEPIRAQRAGPGLRLRRWTQRNPLAAGLLVGLGLASAILLVLLQRNAGLLVEKGEQIERARALGLVGASIDQMQKDQVLALLLARDANRILPDDPQTLSQLYAAAAGCYERAIFRHDAAVADVSVDPRRGLVATASMDGTVGLWDMDGRQLDRRRIAPECYFAKFTPDGSWLLVGAMEKALLLPVTDEQRFGEAIELPPHPVPPGEDQANVREGTISPDGRLLILASTGSKPLLWRTADLLAGNASPLVLSSRIGSFTTGLRFSADSGMVLVPGGFFPDEQFEDGVPRLFRSSGEPVACEGWRHEHSVRSLDLSADGTRLVSASAESARLWSLRDGRFVAGPDLPGHGPGIRCVRFSPDGMRVVAVGDDGRAAIWDLRGEQPEPVWATGFFVPLRLAEFSPDGRYLVVAGNAGCVRVVDLDGEVVADCRGHAARVNQVAWCPATAGPGLQLVTSARDGSARRWQLVDPFLPRLRGHRGAVVGACFVDSGVWYGATALTMASDGCVRLWDRHGNLVRGPIEVGATRSSRLRRAGREDQLLLACGEALQWLIAGEAGPELRPIPGRFAPQVKVSHLAPDGERILAGADYYTAPLRLGSAQGGVEFEWLPEKASPVRNVAAAAFSPAAPFRLVAVKGRQALLIDCSQEPWAVVERVRCAVALESLAWSPDGATVALGSQQGQIELRDAGLVRKRSLRAHNGTVRMLCYSPDGRLLASAGADGTARLTDVAQGREVLTLAGYAQVVTTVAFAMDGNELLTGSVDRTAQVWPVDPRAMRAHVDRLLALRDYTAAQREAFAGLLVPSRHADRNQAQPARRDDARPGPLETSRPATIHPSRGPGR